MVTIHVTLDPDTGEIRGVIGPSLAGQALSVQLTDSYFSKVAGAQVERELPAPEAIAVPLLMPGGVALLALVLIAVGWIRLRRVRT